MIVRGILIAVTFVFSAIPVTHAVVIEQGDLNIIVDAGNPSDGLRFLDMFYGNGMTQAAALANARATYGNARLATPSENDDLFAAAGISYSGPQTASDAYAAGLSQTISSGADYDAGALRDMIGHTSTNLTRWWTDPDGTSDPTSTRDYNVLGSFAAFFSQDIVSPPGQSIGWLIVSPPSASAPEVVTEISDDLLDIIEDPTTAPELVRVLGKAVTRLEDALVELARLPPDNKAALKDLEKAVQKIEAAVEDMLLIPAEGDELMEPLVNAARQLAETAIEEAIERGGKPHKILKAEDFLAEGNALQNFGSFSGAINAYTDALKKAEGA